MEPLQKYKINNFEYNFIFDLLKKFKNNKTLFQQTLKNKQSYLHKDVENDIINVIDYILKKGIIAFKKKKPILFSLNSNTYTPNKQSEYYWSKFNLTRLYNFSYCDIKSALKILDYYNIIRIDKGFRVWLYQGEFEGKNMWSFQDSQLTKIYINPPENWINIDDIDVLDIISLFSYKIDENRPLAIIKDKINNSVELLSFKQEKTVFKINEFLKSKNLSQFLYQRIYNIINNIKQYGRIYSPFQGINGKSRRKLLERKGLKEFDFKSCAANIIYYLETGKIYSGDIYNDFMSYLQIPISDFPLFRDIFKTIFIILLNCPESKCKQILYLICKNENLYKNNIYPSKIINTFQHHFPVFNKYIFTKSSALTQYLESEICIKILNVLINDDLFPLSCHDSFYFPIEDYKYYCNLSYQIFFNVIDNYKNSLVIVNDILYKKKEEKDIKIIYNKSVSFSLLFINNIIMKIVDTFDRLNLVSGFT